MFMKAGDIAPTLRIDTNADVTGASSKVAHIRRFHQSTVTTKTLVTSGDPTLGVLEYDWVAGDTNTPGTYAIEAVVTFSGGDIQTFPQRSYLELVILP